jgi:hypothetical protein
MRPSRDYTSDVVATILLCVGLLLLALAWCIPLG